MRHAFATCLIVLLAAACTRPAHEDTIVVFNAGSLGPPLRAALDTFAAREHVQLQQENAGSLETARKLIDLHKIPDVIALADYEVFPELLMPAQTTWYVDFARNRMVLGYTSRSKFANEISTANWWQVLQRPGVQVGRSDPNLDPNGYRTLLVLQLAARYYNQPRLYDQLLAASPARNVRPKEADLVGVLQAGELDYIWSYESLAAGAGLQLVHLPDSIDLGSPADTAFYATAVTRVLGKTPRDTLVMRGEPIVYAFSIPAAAPHPALAERFVSFLLSPDGRRMLRAAKLDVLDPPVVVGTGVPAAVTSAIGAARPQ